MVCGLGREGTQRSTCGPRACLRRPQPASWAVPNGPTRRHRARTARSPAGPPASPACSMSRRAALPAALSPRAHCARRSFCAGPTTRTTARIARTEPRLSAAECRVRAHDQRYALVCRSSDAVEAAGVDLVEQRAAHRLHSCSPWTGWCDCAPLSPHRLVWASLTVPFPAPSRLPAAARPQARPTDAVLPQLCPNRRAPRSTCPRAWFGSEWRGVGSCTRRPMVHIPSRPRLCCTPQSPYISPGSAWVEV